MAAELATTERRTLAERPTLSRQLFAVEKEQRQILGEYVASQMVDGIDYGVIPGTENKTLLKPGAEKLTSLFKCSARFSILKETEDFEQGFFFYKFRCDILTMDGDVVAEGYGSCNSYESKYRYRNDDRTCPACKKKSTIKKSKFPPRDRPNDPPGFYCFEKAGGCGAVFAHNDPNIIDQRVGKIENPDRADVANTVLKMAKKRAQVDAAIALARCSDMFTQDAEDIAENESHRHADNPQQKTQPTQPTQPAKTATPPAAGPDIMASARLAETIIAAVQTCKTLDDLHKCNNQLRKLNEAKMTGPDNARVTAEFLKRDASLKEQAKGREEFGPGADEE